jgi:hypothetical protein
MTGAIQRGNWICRGLDERYEQEETEKTEIWITLQR